MKWLCRLYRRWIEINEFEWRRVPPPNWASKRGWRDYW
jgi:hypothetical protein